MNTQNNEIIKNNKRTILDEVLSSQKEVDLQSFEPERFVSDLLGRLDSREKNILSKRFGLDGEKAKTLESLGRQYGITRERVRQIQAMALKDLRKSINSGEIARATKVVQTVLAEAGGVLEQNDLLTRILGSENSSAANKAALIFIFNLSDDIQKEPESDQIRTSWILNRASLDKVLSLIKKMEEVFSEVGKPLAKDKLVLAVNDKLAGDDAKVVTTNEIEVAIKVSKNIAQNPFDEYGLIGWSDVMPKGVRDKAYMVVRRFGKPMHFMKITEAINKAKFDQRRAFPQTVHNELIKDQRFVLVGRGLYALKEWGYKPGTVADVITEILKEQGGPMNRKDLLQEVLKRRIVKRNTVLIGLQNKSKFRKIGREDYSLATEE